ncbi:hypothetical protein [Pseudaestuariivita rosea]|uniref:hypothetical protein n=1 Tax=Pseudaestuariivita rosea TaxID=2763263 RepID=UPI001F383776|nr:hypothetical protein [Pseudaestuariivita rosea]
MSFAARDAPWFMLDIACVDHTVEKITDPLLADFPMWQVFGKVWLGFKEPFQLGLGCKAA